MNAKIIVPVVTVFNQNGTPDHEANKIVIDYMLRNQVDGILVLGSAGEFPGLDTAEKQRFLEFYADYADGRTALYAGTGCERFADTLALSRLACDLGYQAPLVIGPYYYGMDQEHIFTFYDTLAKSLQRDLMIYNYPARSGHNVAAQTVQRLVQANPNIVGLKDTVAEPAHTSQVCRATEGTGFQVYSGYDDQFLYNLSAGGTGSIGGLANIVPDIWHDLVCSARRNDMVRSMQLSRLLHKLMVTYETGFSASFLFKKLLACRGLGIAPRAVFPFDDSSADTAWIEQLLHAVLEEYRSMPQGA